MVRYGIAAGLTLVVAVTVAFLVSASTQSHLTTIALIVTTIGLLAISLLIGNLGWHPRLNGPYLDVATLIGRQSVDLARLTATRWERSRGGAIWIRLHDDITDVSIQIPVPYQVRPAITQALSDAITRGVQVPRRITNLFNLPPVPGAPRNGGSNLAVLAGVLVGILVFGVVFGLIASS
ncbi:hypothetical protein ACQHIV_13740 [Kribbella sp. GL6]|uniref:hypothetical protein n=1 Tax=Kribbella sp. GL6 TaxID=3419765 RepID=UPI003CFCC1F9